MSVLLSASGVGLRPSDSRRARTKGSMPLRGHDLSLTSGHSGREGGMNAQCDLYSAPCSIHRRSKLIWADDNFFPLFKGGIRSSSSFDVTRLSNSLFATSPGT